MSSWEIISDITKRRRIASEVSKMVAQMKAGATHNCSDDFSSFSNVIAGDAECFPLSPLVIYDGLIANDVSHQYDTVSVESSMDVDDDSSSIFTVPDGMHCVGIEPGISTVECGSDQLFAEYLDNGEWICRAVDSDDDVELSSSEICFGDKLANWALALKFHMPHRLIYLISCSFYVQTCQRMR